ncbi:UDP-glucosyltransferase 2-like [Vanessa cardui]|uniref:UDP-glucosyltransferase 2-like n=1 Tax=Vanessa cardui TaxID=171605 RepID=UPI001F14386C|nr:UDP-glucosyltransferase 2-like [Vanessa cardui]
MLTIIVSLLFVLIKSEAAKILGVFPTPSISHQVVFRPVMLELVKRGHEVKVITTDPAFLKGQAPRNFTEIDIHNISYEHLKLHGNPENKTHPIDFDNFINDFLINLFVKQLNSTEIQTLLSSDEKFDLIFVESWVRPALVFSHIYDAPVIEFSSLGGINSALEAIGAASHPLIYPNAMHRKIYNLTLWDKITELYTHYSCQYYYMHHEQIENEMLKSVLGSNIPDLKDLRQNVRMLFLNVHPIWDFNRPVPPNVLYLAGLHQKPREDLPKDLKIYLDSKRNGVIYVSFGHKNVKLFITQGGLQSTDEAITAGVPLIGIPMLADQWYNAKQYVKFNIGKRLLLETLTEDLLMDAIETIMGDKSYIQNIVKLRSFMIDQPQPPIESAVWWTEHVLRHTDVAYRRTPAANLHWTEYYELKIMLFLLSVLITLLSLTVLVIHTIVTNIKYCLHLKVKEN